MTDDEGLNQYLYALQTLADQLNGLKEEIRTNIKGVGEEYCISSLEFIATCYSNIKNNVANQYYIDRNNK